MAESTRDINLITGIAEEEVKTGGYRRKINVVVIAILLLVAVVIACLFGYWLYLISWGTRIESQTKSAQDEISSKENQRKEITRRALVVKVDEAQKFLSSTVPFSISLDKLIGLLKDSGSTLDSSKFTNDGKMTVGGEAPASDNFGKLVDGLTNEQLAKTFGNVNLTSLTFTEDKPFYTFTIDLRFLEKGLLKKNGGGTPEK